MVQRTSCPSSNRGKKEGRIKKIMLMERLSSRRGAGTACARSLCIHAECRVRLTPPCVDQECDLVSGLNNSLVQSYNKTSALLKGSEQLAPLVAAVKSCGAACKRAMLPTCCHTSRDSDSALFCFFCSVLLLLEFFFFKVLHVL